MSLTRKKNYYLIKNFFPEKVIAGFTREGVCFDSPLPALRTIFRNYRNLSFAHLSQVHGSGVKFIDKPGFYQGDGVFTKTKNIVLFVKTADCLPLFFADSDSSLIGLIHLGWRSAAAGILDNIKFKLDSFKVVAGVGLRSCCFEVKKDFVANSGLGKWVKQDKQYFFDPIDFSYQQLNSRGLIRGNFYDINICSLHNQKKFFSYRRNKTDKRIYSFIAIIN